MTSYDVIGHPGMFWTHAQEYISRSVRQLVHSITLLRYYCYISPIICPLLLYFSLVLLSNKPINPNVFSAYAGTQQGFSGADGRILDQHRDKSTTVNCDNASTTD